MYKYKECDKCSEWFFGYIKEIIYNLLDKKCEFINLKRDMMWYPDDINLNNFIKNK